MKCVLLSITTGGLRSISKNITLKFYPYTAIDELNMDKKNIKGIYGPNGSGKSSIIASVEIYKQLCLSEGFLFQTDVSYNLRETINKVEKKFLFEATFATYGEGETEPNVYTHSILIENVDGSIFIKEEKLSKLLQSSRSLNDKKEEIYVVNNGVLSFPLKKYQTKVAQLFIEQTKNRLDKSSAVSLIRDFIRVNGNKIKGGTNNFLYEIIMVYKFTNSISVYMEDNEFQREFDIISHVKEIASEDPTDIKNKLLKQIYISDEDDLVSKDDFKEYIEKIEYLKNFIQIFKSSLKDIRIDKKIDRDFYICKKIFVYPDFEISSSRESSGILKLMRLYDYLENVVEGKIVFIDELDVNLHDVYLEKLLSYLAEYTTGQLCFTTHNLSCMEYLKKYKNGLDFLGENLEVVPWIKNGNSSPIIKYRKGMIKGSPFNVEVFDFFRAFKMEE